MSPERNMLAKRLGLLAAVALVYFVLYPEDLDGILGPLQRVLGLSYAVSPWLYVFLGVLVLAWTAFRIWGAGRRVTGTTPSDQPF